MISVIVYGRNDAHGYNLHRRVALSLNCVAEVLTDPDDEILFVDYNTPDGLPTLIEALSDTLTDRCLSVLRVLRVRPELHKERFAGKTHLDVAEPVARNAAARRANPSNRWILSTNTDMVFVPLEDKSLSETCADLADGFYGLPRFELPEWLWEQLPRADPKRALDEIARLGPALRLDEPTISHEWIRFDAPGDFQLILREDLEAVDGFHEEMLLGYHVDSNFSRRMFIHRGSIETLGGAIAGYHCNHNRTPTVYHAATPVTNNLERFFLSVTEATVPAQRSAWGLAEVTLEEVRVRERGGSALSAAVIEAIPEAPPSGPSDAFGDPYALTYDSGHVLPFVVDSLVVTQPGAVVSYIGANPILKRMLATLVDRIIESGTFVVADLDDPGSFQDGGDVFVVDLGVDSSLVVTGDAARDTAWFRTRLDRVFSALQSLVELERKRLERGAHPHRIVLVNSASAYWNAYVLAQLDCGYTTTHSRVRRAAVKVRPEGSAAVAVPSSAEVMPSSAEVAPSSAEETPKLGTYVLSQREGAVIDVYRRRVGFRVTIDWLITAGAWITRASRLGRQGERPALGIGSPPVDPMVAGVALSPMEAAVIAVYRRRHPFRAIVNGLVRSDAATTRAARLVRSPRRVSEGSRDVAAAEPESRNRLP